MERDWSTRWANRLLCIVLGGGLFYFGVQRLLPILLPFLLAALASMIIRPMAAWISSRFRIPPRLCAVTLWLLLLVGISFVAGWVVNRLLLEAGSLLSRLLEEYGSFEGAVDAWILRLEEVLGGFGLLPEGDGRFRDRIWDLLSRLLPGLLSSLAAWLSGFAGHLIASLPSFFFSTVVTVIAGFYFCLDWEGITASMTKRLPPSLCERSRRWRSQLQRVSWRYLKAYLILLLITLALLFVGFLMLDVREAFLLASITALVDLLPVLGIGTVLLPWAGVVLLQGEYRLGVGLLVLYGVALLLRQIIEPRLVGKSLGLHPLFTVLVTYAGWKLLGVTGMIAAPFLALLIKGLFRITDVSVNR